MAIGLEGEIDVRERVDDREWSDALDAMMVRLEVATGDASLDAAKLVRTITQGKLTERAHDPLHFSNAPPGSPPAEVSGRLAESIDTARDGPMSAIVGPTGLPYARIQELGGDMFGHPFMVFAKEFEGHITVFHRTFVHLPMKDVDGGRPYLKPATEMAVESGGVRDIYVEHWTAAIEG